MQSFTLGTIIFPVFWRDLLRRTINILYDHLRRTINILRSFACDVFPYDHLLYDLFLMIFCRTIFYDIRSLSYDHLPTIFFHTIFCLTMFCLVIKPNGESAYPSPCSSSVFFFRLSVNGGDSFWYTYLYVFFAYVVKIQAQLTQGQVTRSLVTSSDLTS